MRRRWIWLGGLALLGVAFLSLVVLRRLLVEPLKAADNPHLDGVLNAIAAEYAESGPAAALALAPLALPEAEAIAVVFYTQGGASTSELVRSLSTLGISAHSEGENYIVTYVPLQHLTTVSTLAGVVRIEAMIPMQPFQSSGPTASPSPAVAAHGVQAWWTAGYTGQGVKVGIIDGGFDNYSQAVQAGEVPAPAAVRCYLQKEDAIEYSPALADCGGTAHGTAVVEALLDVAPEVTVYLASIQRTDELKDVVAWMVGEGVEVINHSAGLSWDGPGDGTSPIELSSLKTVDYAVQNGITWINAAGNSNLQTWYGAFRPHQRVLDKILSSPWYWHLFSVPGLSDPNDEICGFVELEQGDLLRIQLRWEDNDWLMAERNLDILVFDPQDQEFAQQDMGKGVQMGHPQDKPTEFFWAEAPVTGTYCIRVRFARKPNVTDPAWIQLMVWIEQDMTPASGAGSITSPADSQNPGLLAVGATDHTANQTIEPFSSRGPTPDGRVKPDIVGVDRVHSTVYQGLFEGTSQAAPHVAGLAALVIQRFRDSELFDTPAEVANYLRTNAAPRPGVPNHIWGQGLALLPAPAVSQACPPHGPSPDLACDKENLLAAKAELIGTDTGALSTWQQGTDIADFEGIRIYGSPPRVYEVNPRQSSLLGQIPPELGNLAQLERLDLSGALTGTIPPELGKLANLEILYLSYNQLTGSIPPALGNLASLKRLHLNDNQLTGSIPPELGNLANLERLNLKVNQLTGSIPPALGDLTKLIHLRLFSNLLTGSIPPALGSLANLEILVLRRNQLAGPIPPALGNLANLEWLHLPENQLTGSIPPELGNLANLRIMFLFDNQLTGSIPPELGNLANLEWLSLHENQLTGSIPPALGNMANLEKLWSSRNQLTGSIPPALGNLANLERLDLYENQLTGSIPPALGNLANLRLMDLSYNQLTGSIPPALGNMANLEELNLSHNQLTRIPPALGDLANLTWLNLGFNQLTGSIPPALGDLANLWHLDLAGNQFTVIPLELSSLPHLTSLFLSPNQLWSIPPNLPKTTNILFHTWDGTIHLLCIPNEHPICPHPDCCE